MSDIDQQFIEYIVKSLVGKPDAVSIERTIDEKGVLLELTVDPEDLGRVIGKRGATAQSLRTLLRALGTKNDARYNLKIVDNGVEKPERRERDESRPPKEEKKTEEPAAVEAVEAEVDEVEDTESNLSKTRKELEELDDLDL
ncbi:MAG: KH domain-containing protein [Candidatus Saccharimonadales bacterium]